MKPKPITDEDLSKELMAADYKAQYGMSKRDFNSQLFWDQSFKDTKARWLCVARAAKRLIGRKEK